MNLSPIHPLIEKEEAFVARIKKDLEVLLRENLAMEEIYPERSAGFEGVYAAWFFSGHTEWTIDRLCDRLAYIHRQLSRWCAVEPAGDAANDQAPLLFHVRRHDGRFQIFDESGMVWPIDLEL